MVESASDKGMQTNTLSTVLKWLGNISKRGTNRSSCLVEERMTALDALPIDWKKLDVTIWNPTMGNAAEHILNPFMAIAISSSSVVNNLATK